ncbi:MAG: porin family protein [Porphyromonas sp.]|nr:porin family protein [Porphyromonas sp.]
MIRIRPTFVTLACLLGVLVFFAPVQVNAQKEVPKNRPYADMKPHHLGFFIGSDVQDLRISNAGFVDPSGRHLFADLSGYSPGFVVGVIGNMNLLQDLDLRFVPALHFGERAFAYSDGKKEIKRFSQRASYLTAPLMLKYSSQRLNNMRPYILAGGYAALEIGQKKGSILEMKPFDFGVRLGIGCDFYLPFFKLCPELSFSWGFANVIQSNRSDLAESPDLVYTQTISKALTRMVMLTFNFE